MGHSGPYIFKVLWQDQDQKLFCHRSGNPAASVHLFWIQSNPCLSSHFFFFILMLYPLSPKSQGSQRERMTWRNLFFSPRTRSQNNWHFSGSFHLNSNHLSLLVSALSFPFHPTANEECGEFSFHCVKSRMSQRFQDAVFSRRNSLILQNVLESFYAYDYALAPFSITQLLLKLNASFIPHLITSFSSHLNFWKLCRIPELQNGLLPPHSPLWCDFKSMCV